MIGTALTQEAKFVNRELKTKTARNSVTLSGSLNLSFFLVQTKLTEPLDYLSLENFKLKTKGKG